MADDDENTVREGQQMARALEVFEAAVFEAAFDILSPKDGDAACDIVAVGLAEIVGGLTAADALEFIAPNAPRIVVDTSDDAGAPVHVLNEFWYRDDTFAPLYYAIAREFYERVRPSNYPLAPVAIIEENDSALFGCELRDIDFARDVTPLNHDGSMLLWAGCSASAVRLCLQKSIAVPLGYSLLFRYVSDHMS